MTATGAKETAKAREVKTPQETDPMHAPGPDPEWCAERAAHALRWLAMHYPESAGSEALHGPQDAAHAAAVAGDEEAFLEALREYMRRGRAVALGIRREAA